MTTTAIQLALFDAQPKEPAMPSAEFKGGAASALIDLDGVPYDPNPTQEISLVEQAGRPPITLYIQVEGLGGVSDYSLRIEVPAYDDMAAAVGNVLAEINKLLFAMDWWGTVRP